MDKITCNTCNANKNTCSKRRSQKHLSITLNITDRCNDNCSFCWHKDNLYKDRDMNKKDIDKMFDILLRQFPDYDFSLIFIGGEPTLNTSIISYSMDKLIELKEKYHGTIITNGFKNINQVKNIVKKYQNLKIVVSLPSDYTQRDNVDEYIYMQNDINILFSLVITEEDLKKNLYDKILYWKNKGVQRLYLIHKFDMNNIEYENNYENILFNKIFKLNELIDNNFIITNFYPIEKIKYLNNNLINISYFSDNNFYISNKSKFFNNSSIGNAVDGIDMKKYYNLLEKIPCFCCELKEICSYDPGLFFKDNKVFYNNNFCTLMKIFIKIKEAYNE